MRKTIERWFAAWGHFAYRRAGLVVVAVLLVTGALATQLSNLTLDTSTEGFLREGDPIRVDYEAFRHQFGRDDAMLIAIEGERVFDLDFLARLRALHEEIDAKVPKLQEVTSLVNARETRGVDDQLIVGELLEDWPETPAELAEIEKRAMANPLYRNNLLSDDGKVTTIVIETDAYSSKSGAVSAADALDFDEPDASAAPPPFITGEENSEIVNAVMAIVERHRAPGFEIYTAGSPIMVDRLAYSMQHDMRRFTALSILVIAVFLYGLFRRVAAVVLPLVVVVLSLVATLGVMGLAGVPISLPTQILPSFLLAVGVGDSVHVLAIFYQRLRAGDSREDAIVGALAHSGLAIVMTTLTTAAGIASFLTAELAPVSDLGAVGPIGVILALFFTIILLPALIALFPMRAASASDASDTSRPSVTQAALVRVGSFAGRHAIAVSLVWAGLVAISLLGASQVRFSHDPISWFPPENSLRRGTEFINDRLAGTTFLEVVVDSKQENGLHDPELLARLDEMRRFALGFQKGDVFVGKVVSPADVLKEIHQALNENDPKFYRIPTDRQLVAQEFLLFENSGSDDLEKVVDSQFRLGRVTLKFPFLDAIQYGSYIETINLKFQEILGDQAEMTITGLMRLATRTITAIVHSMATSYLLAFILITPMMVVLIGRLKLGLMGMLPNLAPVILALGVMGWLGMPLDAFTLLIGSIALGLAVDDTIHFMHNFRRGFEATGDIAGSISATLATAGQAMLFTSLVLASGFFVYLFASMQNLFNFGLLTGFAILVAFAANVTLAPALVTLFAKPAGRRPGSEES